MSCLEPTNGGPPAVVLKGNFTFQCASHANRCVLLELRDGHSLFYALDPLTGRGSLLAKTDPVGGLEYVWDLSGDGKFVAFLQDVKNSANSTIKVVSLENNATNSIERLNESVIEVVWDTDNQHLFLVTSGESGIALLRSDLHGNSQVLSTVALGEPIPIFLHPSPDGRYLLYSIDSVDSNAILLENF